MRVAVLTSSRADFGIYLPLIKKLKSDSFFELSIIAFGTHLSPFHGETINQIFSQGFDVNYKVESLLLTDSPESISSAMGLTIIKFSYFWKEHSKDFDLVFCLGDRYEMFSAVTAAIPFNLDIAHIHGGETTLGAIDNIFRHSITLASKYHFVSTEEYALKIAKLTSSDDNVYCVGALSLDNLSTVKYLTIEEFKAKWGVDLSLKTILTTFHPETVDLNRNIYFAEQLVDVIYENSSYHFLITMPNADTSGNVVRKILLDNLSDRKNVSLIENLGSQSYFSAIRECAFLLGNTSSGIIEAASFGKYVINLGNRQKGRAYGNNVFHVEIEKNAINKAIKIIEPLPVFIEQNIYYKSNSADEIIKVLKLIKPHAK